MFLDSGSLLGYNTHNTHKKGWDTLSHPVESTFPGWMSAARETNIVRRINGFLASPFFIITVGLLTVFANVLGAELYVYSAFIFCGLYISILGDDYLPIMPMVVCSYIAPSIFNNPGRSEDSIFYPKNGGIYLLSIFLLFVVSVFVRLIRDKELGGRNFLFAKRRFFWGMVALGGAYVLAGAFSGRYFEHGLNNLVFALLQFISIFVCYWFFTGSVRWDRAPRDYFAWCGFAVGFVVLFEILNIYIVGDVVNSAGVIILDPEKSAIFTGWGNANNIGCMLAMMVPFAFCLARGRRNGWIFCILGVVMTVGVFFTCSRASILGALFATICCFVLILKSSKNRKANLIATISAVLFAIAVVIIFHETIIGLFWGLIDKKLDPSARNHIYYNGLKQFSELPIFGGSFFPAADAGIYEWSNLEAFTSFFPPRWHSTAIQLLASCGITGVLAYGFHRFQTIKLFLERRKTGVVYIGLAIVTLLLMSLLDCHMFNIGPVLFYSMALAFAEKVKIEKNV